MEALFSVLCSSIFCVKQLVGALNLLKYNMKQLEIKVNNLQKVNSNDINIKSVSL